ncbi:hypothetical protein BurJ1DRAFT_3844 [Burkholderiales bacterium JOSHI_001]|nr:hypothetical protein BurJ1DRAFT_3844 [Burkholderiales bacterium JOSHI_001]
MSRAIRSLLPVLCLATLLSGCALQAPRYQPSIDNVEAIKKAGVKANVGAFTVAPGATGGSSISLRGNTMSAPTGDYAAYLADALKQELTLAGGLDLKASVEVGGVLVKNDIAAGGMSTNSGEIEARFVVRSGSQVRYDATQRVDLSWESSFVGAVAIPKAQQQYPVLVQKLIGKLLADPQFLAALR